VPAFALADVPIKRARSPRRWALLAIAAPPLALVFTSVAFGRDAGGAAPALALLCMLDAIVLFLLPALLPEPREKRVRLRADESGVFASGRCILRRAAIASCAIERPLAGTPRVVFFDRAARAELEVALPDDARARALLRALGLDAERSTASFLVDRAKLASPASRLADLGARVFGAVALLLATVGLMRRYEKDWLLVGYPPTLLVFLVAVNRARKSVQVVVGADAIVVHTGARPRVVAHTAVERVSATRGGVEVVLRSGEVVPLCVSSTGETADAHRAALEARLDEALELHALRGDGREAETTRLRRAGRPVDEWVRDLRAFASGAGATYRVSNVSGDRLWHVLEDPAADATARVGAAVALKPSLDDGGRARIRAIARALALPGARVALEAAADADDDADLYAALDDVQEPPRRLR
jgi:hypothetical protein